MTGEPSVTVVIPLHNGDRYIHETISCVLRQTLSDLEVIVIDDGSTDHGTERVRPLLADPRLKLVMKEWSGIAATRNAGLMMSSAASDFVLFLDQDDLIAADLISALHALLAEHEGAVAAYAIADFIDADGSPLHAGAFAAQMRAREICVDGRLHPTSPEAPMTFSELFIGNHVYPPSGVLIRKGLLERVGGFDESYRVADDWDALVRLSRLGPLIPVDEIKVGYRRHDTNASKNTPLNIRETRAVWANTYWDTQNSVAQQRQLHTAWRALQHQRSTAKFAAAKTALASWRLVAAAGLAADATAHRLLVAPPRRWRTRRSPLPSLIDESRPSVTTAE